MSDEIKSISISGKDKAYGLDLGLIDYAAAYDLQLKIVNARQSGLLRQDVFLILEHPPVFTMGLRGGKKHLKVTEDFLSSRKIPLVHIERGGDITYHGPGQLIIYPIVNLRKGRWRVISFVEALEEVMIRIANDWGIRAERNSLGRGVWVGHKKLGSVGIAVRRFIAFHGLALNVNTDPEPFEWIDPCGLAGIAVASMRQLKKKEIPLPEVCEQARKHIRMIFKKDLEKVSLAAFEIILSSTKNHE